MYGGLIGIAAATILARTQYRKLIPYAPWLMGIGTVLLVLVFIPGIGTEIKGATRWLGVGAFSFQPAEFVKLAVVCYLAALGLSARDLARDPELELAQEEI
jgi:cell division protein FtsW